MAVDADGFTAVRSRRRGRGPPAEDKQQAAQRVQADGRLDYSAAAVRRLLQEVRGLRTELEHSRVARQICAEVIEVFPWKHAQQTMAYYLLGLGSFGTNQPQRCQLALFLMLVDRLRAHRQQQGTPRRSTGHDRRPEVSGQASANQGWHEASPVVFDPVFSFTERRVLEELGCMVPEHNECCAYPTPAASLFFLPHGGLLMYENLLAANWQPEALQRVCLIGNNLREYKDRVPAEELAATAPHMVAALPWLRPGLLLPEDLPVPAGVLNSTCIQVFEPPSALPAASLAADGVAAQDKLLVSELDVRPLPAMGIDR